MFVAIPTAIPLDPFTRRFGNFEGRTRGSFSVPSKLSIQSTVSFSVLEHRLGGLREPALRVSHRGGLVLRASPVPLAVDQRIAKGKRLDHSGQRVVDREVSMRVEFAQGLPHYTGCLLVLGARTHPQLVHRIQDSALDGFQAVANVG